MLFVDGSTIILPVILNEDGNSEMKKNYDKYKITIKKVTGKSQIKVRCRNRGMSLSFRLSIARTHIARKVFASKINKQTWIKSKGKSFSYRWHLLTSLLLYFSSDLIMASGSANGKKNPNQVVTKRGRILDETFIGDNSTKRSRSISESSLTNSISERVRELEIELIENMELEDTLRPEDPAATDSDLESFEREDLELIPIHEGEPTSLESNNAWGGEALAEKPFLDNLKNEAAIDNHYRRLYEVKMEEAEARLNEKLHLSAKKFKSSYKKLAAQNQALQEENYRFKLPQNETNNHDDINAPSSRSRQLGANMEAPVQVEIPDLADYQRSRDALLVELLKDEAKKTVTQFVVVHGSYPRSIIDETKFKVLQDEINKHIEADHTALDAQIITTQSKQGALVTTTLNHASSAWLIMYINENHPNFRCFAASEAKFIRTAFIIWIPVHEEEWDYAKEYLSRREFDTTNWILLKTLEDKSGTKFLMLGDDKLKNDIDTWLKEHPSKRRVDGKIIASNEMKFPYKACNILGSVHALASVSASNKGNKFPFENNSSTNFCLFKLSNPRTRSLLSLTINYVAPRNASKLSNVITDNNKSKPRDSDNLFKIFQNADDHFASSHELFKVKIKKLQAIAKMASSFIPILGIKKLKSRSSLGYFKLHSSSELNSPERLSSLLLQLLYIILNYIVSKLLLAKLGNRDFCPSIEIFNKDKLAAVLLKHGRSPVFIMELNKEIFIKKSLNKKLITKKFVLNKIRRNSVKFQMADYEHGTRPSTEYLVYSEGKGKHCISMYLRCIIHSNQSKLNSYHDVNKRNFLCYLSISMPSYLFKAKYLGFISLTAHSYGNRYTHTINDKTLSHEKLLFLDYISYPMCKIRGIAITVRRKEDYKYG